MTLSSFAPSLCPYGNVFFFIPQRIKKVMRTAICLYVILFNKEELLGDMEMMKSLKVTMSA